MVDVLKTISRRDCRVNHKSVLVKHFRLGISATSILEKLGTWMARYWDTVIYSLQSEQYIYAGLNQHIHTVIHIQLQKSPGESTLEHWIGFAIPFGMIPTDWLQFSWKKWGELGIWQMWGHSVIQHGFCSWCLLPKSGASFLDDQESPDSPIMRVTTARRPMF